MKPATLKAAAVAALIVLMGVSLALALLVGATARTGGLPPGAALAVVKLVVLGFLFTRIRRFDTYAMQWSSMFILLFFAEGVVRATTDPRASAIAGGVEIMATVVYFFAILAILRPMKQRARQAENGP